MFPVTRTRYTVYNGLVMPYFDYCSPLWDTISGKRLQDKLQKYQNRAARVISGASYGTRSTDVLGIRWETLDKRRLRIKYLTTTPPQI